MQSMTNPVRQWRETLGLTQEQAAHRIGVTGRNYQAYEAGAYDPPVPVRKVMRALALGIELEPWPMEVQKGKRR